MAICSDCSKDMLSLTPGCIRAVTFFSTAGIGKPPSGGALPVQRIPFGLERRFGFQKQDPAERCHDCNAQLFFLHHSGCDVEECPRCGKQQISCGCRTEEWTPV